jgi:hypothetical protein
MVLLSKSRCDGTAAIHRCRAMPRGLVCCSRDDHQRSQQPHAHHRLANDDHDDVPPWER